MKNPIHGRLKVQGTRIFDGSGQEVRLRGISTHGIHWYPFYVNSSCFQTLRDDWKANVIRLAMYLEEWGYTEDGELEGRSFAKMVDGIEACRQLGLYVIVDWHVSKDETPLKHKEKAINFFRAIAGKYGDDPHILYEICNEPNGRGNDYATQISPYADQVIDVIRTHAPNAIVLIGSGFFSKKPVEAWKHDKGRRANVLYTLHHYCDGDFDTWSPLIARAVKQGCPIIATEVGDSNAAETDRHAEANFKRILAFYEKHGISWQAWSLASKREPTSLLAHFASSSGSWTDDEISPAGHLVRAALRNAAAVA